MVLGYLELSYFLFKYFHLRIEIKKELLFLFFKLHNFLTSCTVNLCLQYERALVTCLLLLCFILISNRCCPSFLNGTISFPCSHSRVRVQQQVISFCEQSNIQIKKLTASRLPYGYHCCYMHWVFQNTLLSLLLHKVCPTGVL